MNWLDFTIGFFVGIATFYTITFCASCLWLYLEVDENEKSKP